MANLKNKILQKLRSGKDLEEVFDSLSAVRKIYSKISLTRFLVTKIEIKS